MNNTCYDLMLEAIFMCNMLEDQLSFPLYACSREAIKRYRPFLEALGLTYTQYIMLLAIWENGAISVRDLGRKLYLDSGTLTPVLKHLEQVGFITRRRWEKDERVLIVTITDKGLELRARAQELSGLIPAAPLADEEVAQLRHLLDRFLQGVEDTAD